MKVSCCDCGMMVEIDDYHPYAACLMFKGCRNGDIVNANLDAVRAFAFQEGVESVQPEQEPK